MLPRVWNSPSNYDSIVLYPSIYHIPISMYLIFSISYAVPSTSASVTTDCEIFECIIKS